MNTLNVEYRKVEALIPYARNPRTHSEAQITKIAASIVEYGWTNPVLVDGDNGIIAGHGRLAAARKLGLDQVPVIELAHLTTAQKRALVIADNRLAEKAGWDRDILAIELQGLLEQDLDFDVAITGFEMPEIDVHVVWNPRAKLNRAEESLLGELLQRIETTPIEERTYGSIVPGAHDEQ